MRLALPMLMCLFAIVGCKSSPMPGTKPPTSKVLDVSPTDADAEGFDLDVKVQIENRMVVPFDVGDVKYTFSVEGVEVADTTAQFGAVIAPGAKETVMFKIPVGWSDLRKVVSKLPEGDLARVTMTFDGEMMLPGVPLVESTAVGQTTTINLRQQIKEAASLPDAFTNSDFSGFVTDVKASMPSQLPASVTQALDDAASAMPDVPELDL